MNVSTSMPRAKAKPSCPVASPHLYHSAHNNTASPFINSLEGFRSPRHLPLGQSGDWAAPRLIVVIYGHGLDVPDFGAVFADGAVGGELAHACDVEDGHAGPVFLVMLGLIDLVLGGEVGGEVGKEHVFVARPGGNPAAGGRGPGRRREVAGGNLVEDFT